MIEMFKQFLVNQGIDELFEERYDPLFGRMNSVSIHLSGFYAYIEPESLIGGAFDWRNTLEGHEYWEQLHDKWHSVLKMRKLLTDEQFEPIDGGLTKGY